MTSPTPVIAGAWRLVVRGEYLGRAVYNSLGWLGDVGQAPSAAFAQDLAAHTRDRWIATILLQQSGAYILREVATYSLQDGSVSGAVTASAQGARAVASTRQPLSSAICAKVSLSTGRRGARFRGRTGICGITEEDIEGNTLSSTYVTNMGSVVSQFRVSMESVPINGGQAQQQGSLAVISERYALATPVTSAVLQSTIGTRVARLR